MRVFALFVILLAQAFLLVRSELVVLTDATYEASVTNGDIVRARGSFARVQHTSSIL